jgi:hypothetical protein
MREKLEQLGRCYAYFHLLRFKAYAIFRLVLCLLDLFKREKMDMFQSKIAILKLRYNDEIAEIIKDNCKDSVGLPIGI